jgi:hypothetical protein
MCPSLWLQWNLFLHDVKKDDVSLEDIINDEGFFRVINMLYHKIEKREDRFKKEEITKAIISNMNTMSKSSYEYEKEDSINQLKISILLRMNNNGTILPLLEEYLIKYGKNEFKNEIFQHKSGFTLDKNDLIDFTEAIIDFSSPKSAIKRILGLLRD